MPGTLCGQPADDPRQAVPRLCLLRVFQLKLNFTQLGTSWHATLRVNGLCVAASQGGAALLSLLGVWLSPCVQRCWGSSGSQDKGRSQDVCFVPRD